MLILGFPDYAEQAQALAAALELPYAEVALHRFPDGETRLTVPTELPEHVIVCRSLDHPDGKLVQMMFTARTARQLGVQRLTLVAPYLCYMRQDIAFAPGEAISQRIIGTFLAELFDDVITVDPHLHRTDELEHAVPADRTVCLSATAPLGDYVHEHWASPILLGPDAESEQWVRAIAERHTLPYAVAEKERLGDHEVRVRLPALEIEGRLVVLVDDVASTARTLAEAANGLMLKGARAVHALVSHALFDDSALERLRAAGVSSVISTDSVAHPTNAVALAGLLADGVREMLTHPAND